MVNLDALHDDLIEHGCIISRERDTAPTIERENVTHSDLPPRTKLRLQFTPEPGSCSNTELWLPDADAWNGRFVALGNGGAAGSIWSDRFIGYLRSGHAVASSDMGTAPDSDSGIANPAVWADFGHRATHLMATASKALIQAAYGRLPDFSYFLGSSTGGQQGLQAAQRHPADFDGIVAQVPAHCRTPLHAYFLWNAQILNRCPFSEEQEQIVIEAANTVMAPRTPPPFTGTVVADPRCDASLIAAVIALARERDPSLTDRHATALERLFTGPRHETTGARIFDGVPLGSRFLGAAGHLYVFAWVFGPEVDCMALNFADDIDTYTAKLAPDLNAEDADLSAFRARGGKLIMTSGSADQVVPYHATLDYYERLVEHVGSLEATQDFCRYFLLPGRDHNTGGPGLNRDDDLFGLIKRWREAGTPPDSLHCARQVDGDEVYAVDVPPYPALYGNHAGPRGGVGRVDAAFRLQP